MIRAIFQNGGSAWVWRSPHNIISTQDLLSGACMATRPMERNTGNIPVDPDHSATMPVLIMAPGVNLDPAAYGWLARKLAGEGIVTVLISS